MTPGSQLCATIELVGLVWATNNSAENVIHSYFKKRRFAGSSDRRIIKNLVYKVVRHQARLRWWINRTCLKTSVTSRTFLITYLALENNTSLQDFINLFSGDTYQPRKLTLSEINTFKYLLGKDINHFSMPTNVILEYPKFVEKSLESIWGVRFKREMVGLNATAPIDLRVNTLKTNREKVVNLLLREGYHVTPTTFSSIGLRLNAKKQIRQANAFKLGYFEIQDEGSQIISLLCGAAPEMNVIDFCAGAGGKTLALAADMENRGQLFAFDTSSRRLAKIKSRLNRAGVTNVKSRVILPENDQWLISHPFMADRVLCDVPCSGSGVWRRHPDHKWQITKSSINELVNLQKTILLQASYLTKPGGRLIYSTCSVLPEENNDQMSWFLQDNKNFRLLPIAQISNRFYELNIFKNQDTLHLTPSSTATDGYFCAVFERVS